MIRDNARPRLAIIGLDHHGQVLARLSAARLGRVTVFDPFCDPASGIRHDEMLAEQLAPMIDVWPDTQLTPAILGAILDQHDLSIACYDAGLRASNHWINEWSLRYGRPVVFLHADEEALRLGPWLSPSQPGPCFLCWRLRWIASRSDPQDALEREERAGKERHPRPVTPLRAAAWLDAALGEALELLLQPPGMSPATVWRWNSDGCSHHRILPLPACPACGGGHAAPPVMEIDDPVQVTEQVVDDSGGIVRRWLRVTRLGERPVVWRADLAWLGLSAGVPAAISVAGRGRNEAQAQRSAIGEAVERYCGFCHDRDVVVRAAADELPGPHVLPEVLAGYTPEQCAILDLRPPHRSQELDWVPGRTLGSGRAVYVPAQAVYLRYPLHEADHPFIGTTSSGLACGCRRDDAVLRAAYEVVERDAFLRTWHGRLPTRRFHSRSIPDQDLQVDLATWSARGIELDIHALTTDVPVQVFLAIARGRLPGGTIGTAIGLGADYTGVAAARQAAYEAMQMWPELMRMLTDPRIAEHAALLVEHPEAVCEPHDHALRYMASRPCADAAMDFLLRRPLMPWNTGDREPPTDPLSELIAGLMGLGCDPVMCDLTTADVRPLGLHVVRVILPGFVPLHFGFGAEHRANPRLSGGGAHGAPVVVPPHPLC